MEQSKLDRINELGAAGEQILPEPLLNGNDLIREGIQPGPEMGRLLNALRDLQLDGMISSRADALEELKKMIRKQ